MELKEALVKGYVQIRVFKWQMTPTRCGYEVRLFAKHEYGDILDQVSKEVRGKERSKFWDSHGYANLRERSLGMMKDKWIPWLDGVLESAKNLKDYYPEWREHFLAYWASRPRRRSIAAKGPRRKRRKRRSYGRRRLSPNLRTVVSRRKPTKGTEDDDFRPAPKGSNKEFLSKFDSAMIQRIPALRKMAEIERLRGDY